MQILSSSNKELSGFSNGSSEETSNNDKLAHSKKGSSDSEKHKPDELSEPKFERNGNGVRIKSKGKKNRRKERKRDLTKNKNIQILGLNCAGILNKLESFEDILLNKQPSIFCLQETKVKRPNQIKTESSKNFTIYELLRKKCNGGGLALGVHNDLQPVWIDQGDDDVEVIVVEVWVNEFPIRIVNGYGPQMSDSIERKQHFWCFLEKQVNNAIVAGAGIIIQMDSNCHLGPAIIEGDLNVQNANGKLFCDFLQRNTHLTIINSLTLCEGKAKGIVFTNF